MSQSHIPATATPESITSEEVTTVAPQLPATKAAAAKVSKDIQAAIAYPRNFTLPSGKRITQFRPLLGRDSVTGHRLIQKGDGEIALSAAMAAQVVKIDGEDTVYEDLLDLEFDDLLEVVGVVVGKSLPSIQKP